MQMISSTPFDFNSSAFSINPGTYSNTQQKNTQNYHQMHNTTTLLRCSSLLISNIVRLKSPTTPHTISPIRKTLTLSLYCTSPSSSSSHVAACTKTTTAVEEESAVDNDNESEKKIREAAGMLDIRVGRVVKAWRHTEADSLYVEEVDVGEAEPRVICSGLVKYIPIDQLQDKKVIVLANLKPRNMRGVKSSGMLMAASDASHENVELLEPPAESVPGERLWFGSEDEKENQAAAASPNQIQKKKIWELVQPHLKTDGSCVAMLGTDLMRTSAGIVVCRSLKNANIS